MERDTAVTIVKVIAVLEWIGAGFGILVGLLLLLGGSLFAQTLLPQLSAEDMAGVPPDQIATYMMIGFAVFGVFLLLLSALGIITGIGLWRMRNWGRILALIGAWLSIVWGVFALLGSFSGAAGEIVVNLLTNLLSIAISVVMIWLFQFESTVVGLFHENAVATTAVKRTVTAKTRKP